MNQKLLTFLALGFGALIILQAALGGWLFIYNIGLTPHEISAYYADKSLHGVLEVLVPHTVYITIALMALLHFLAFIDTIAQSTKTRYIHTLFIIFFLDQFSGVAISMGLEYFSYLKLIAFIGFNIILIVVWTTMFSTIFRRVS